MSWYYAKHGKQEGPADFEALRAMIASGQLGPGDLVWKEGMREWRPVGEVPELTPAAGGGAPASGALGASPGVASAPLPQVPAAGGPSAPPPPAPLAQPPPGIPYITAPPPTSGLAIASLICGLVSLALCWVWAIAGIPAVVCGHLALKGIKASPHRIEGRGMAITGLVTGYLSILFEAVFVIGILWAIVQGSPTSP